MDSDEITLRPATADDWEAISQLLGMVFHSTDEAELRDIEGSVFEPERALVAVDGDLIVGNAAAYTRELTVPGAILPAAHVTLVGVAPTHRRRGLLTRMMHRQLAEVAAAGLNPASRAGPPCRRPPVPLSEHRVGGAARSAGAPAPPPRARLLLRGWRSADREGDQDEGEQPAIHRIPVSSSAAEA